MGALVVGVVQVKGGAGRSTVSTNLAGELSKVGKTVLIDCDMPQGTAASWYSVRQAKGKAGALEAETASTHRELVELVGKHQDADFIVLDGPPRIAELTKAILILADLCIVPIGASVAEVWATSDILTLIEEAKQVKPINIRMLWTRYRPQTKLAQGLTKQVKDELGLVAMGTSLGMRVSYMEALGEGLTAAELGDASAKVEVSFLANEVQKLMRSL